MNIEYCSNYLDILQLLGFNSEMVKCLLPAQETQVLSLGQEDPLEKRTATHSSTLAWRTPWTEEPSGL